MVAQVSIRHDIHTKFHGDLICRFYVMISALLQDYRKTTYPTFIWEVFLRYYSTYPTKFGEHAER